MNSSTADVEANRKVTEKTISERYAYLEAMRRNPQLTLHHEGSARYENSEQLVGLGWMRTTPAFETFAAMQSGRPESQSGNKLSIA